MPTPRDWQRLAQTPAPELRALQDRLLARYVREELYPFSPRYRRVFDEAGVDPRSVRGRDDLRRLPFTTKQDLLEAAGDPARRLDFVLQPTPGAIKEHWGLGRKLALVAGGQRSRDLLRRAYTPCFLTFTTGRSTAPVSFAYTPHDLEILSQGIARMFDLLGISAPSERIANLMPFAPHLAFWAVTLGGFETGRLVVPSGGGKVMGTDGNVRLVERLKATAICGTPGFVHHMIRRAVELGADLSQVRSVVLGAEKVPPGMKLKMIELLRSCGAGEVVISGTYGFTEARMAYGECPAGPEESPGYHLYPDLGVFEVVDPKTGDPVPDGQDGELVYTGIAGHGTCILRYRTGDMVVGGMTWEPCPWCKRTLPRIASELRRVSEQHALNLTKIKGTLVDTALMGRVLSEMRGIEEWQIVLRKEHDDPFGLDQFVVRVALRPGADAGELQREVKARLLELSEVTPNAVEVLPLQELLELLGMETQLKERRFLDERPKA